jgi:hypothetical protein
MPDSPDKLIELGPGFFSMTHTRNKTGWEMRRRPESGGQMVVRGIGEDKVEGNDFRRKRR